MKSMMSRTPLRTRQWPELTLSFGLSPAKFPPVAVVSASAITSANVRAALADMNSHLKSLIDSHEDRIKRTMESYQLFFGNHTYPVQQQFAAFRRKGNLPNSTIPALLLSLELQSGSLFGIHDLSHISGQIVFDTASADESFGGIGGKPVKCSRRRAYCSRRTWNFCVQSTKARTRELRLR